ncbi:MAG: hypothetical protein K8J09_20510, partial [Planctomycetes bacterium]|nr:hypothetical protein [Planctomycetota bacterium]
GYGPRQPRTARPRRRGRQPEVQPLTADDGRKGWSPRFPGAVARTVTLRLCGDIAAKIDATLMPGPDLVKLLEKRFEPVRDMTPEFRREGFYERFPARGQMERIDIIRKRLARQARFE